MPTDCISCSCRTRGQDWVRDLECPDPGWWCSNPPNSKYLNYCQHISLSWPPTLLEIYQIIFQCSGKFNFLNIYLRIFLYPDPVVVHHGVSIYARWLDLEGLSLLKNCSLFRFSSAFKRVIESDWSKLQIDAFCCWSAVSWGILGLGRGGKVTLQIYTFITLMLWLGLNERVILTSRLVKVVKPKQCNTLLCVH